MRNYVILVAALAVVASAAIGIFIPRYVLLAAILLTVGLAGALIYLGACRYMNMSQDGQNKVNGYAVYAVYGLLGILAFIGMIFPPNAGLFLLSLLAGLAFYLVRSNHNKMLDEHEADRRDNPTDPDPTEPPTWLASARYSLYLHYYWFLPALTLAALITYYAPLIKD